MYIENHDNTTLIAALKANIDALEQAANGRIDPALLLGTISDVIEAAKAGYIPLPRVTSDGFIRTEDLDELAFAMNLNHKALASELEVLQATAQVIATIVTGLEENAQQACAQAHEAVSMLLAYHNAASDGSKSVLVLPDHLNGDVTKVGANITSAFSKGSNASIKVISVDTNGLSGNMLELKSAPGVLSNDEIVFVDDADATVLPANMVDGDETTAYEVEIYKLPDMEPSAATDENTMPADRRTSIMKTVRQGSTIKKVPVSWYNGPEGDRLYAEIKAQVRRGSLSLLTMKVADKSGMPLPRLESVQVSADNKNWVAVPCQADVFTTAAGGYIRLLVSANAANYVRIRISQSIAYDTNVANVCHWKVTDDGGVWMAQGTDPAYTLGLSTKRDFFTPCTLIDASNNTIRRKVFSVAAKRYAISLKEISGESYDYATESVATSKRYTFDTALDRVTIKSTENIPSGCSISYDISVDRGNTWTKIVPVQRSGQGAEVLVFTPGGTANPNISGATYLAVTERPKELMLRVRLKSSSGTAPVVSNISINPTFYREV